MSTRKLLGGSQAREGAKRRKRAVNEMLRMSYMYKQGSPQQMRIASLADALETVRKDPRLTDAQKDASFKELLNRKR